MGNAQEVLWTRRIVTAHLTHFIVLLFLEILGLLFLNWLTQAAIGQTEWTFFDPSYYQYTEHYVCDEESVYLLNTEKLTQCGNGDRTECYVSRPSEKKVRDLLFVSYSTSSTTSSTSAIDSLPLVLLSTDMSLFSNPNG